VEKVAVECKRILKDNGSLFWFGDAKNIAYQQVIFDKYFILENCLIWKKPIVRNMNNSPMMRHFAKCTERILFYSNEIVSINGMCVNKSRDFLRAKILEKKGEINLKEINRVL
jgi:site-specific DNA-methyltransferase (adenine-specific)